MCRIRTVLYAVCSHTQTVSRQMCPDAERREREDETAAFAAAAVQSAQTRSTGSWIHNSSPRNVRVRLPPSSQQGLKSNGMEQLAASSSTSARRDSRTWAEVAPGVVLEHPNNRSVEPALRRSAPLPRPPVQTEANDARTSDSAGLTRETCPKLSVTDTGRYPTRCPECVDAAWNEMVTRNREAIAEGARRHREHAEAGLLTGERVMVFGEDVWVCEVDEQGRNWPKCWAGDARNWFLGWWNDVMDQQQQEEQNDQDREQAWQQVQVQGGEEWGEGEFVPSSTVDMAIGPEY